MERFYNVNMASFIFWFIKTSSNNVFQITLSKRYKNLYNVLTISFDQYQNAVAILFITSK